MTAELPPLVLFHPLTMSGAVWQETAPLLVANHAVFTPSAIGHPGGPAVQRRPVTIWDVIDASERYLDEQGLDRPHLAGNSMGGFVALELARRGRAASVCAFSPAGIWSDKLRMQAAKKARRTHVLALGIRPVTPVITNSSIGRQVALRDAAVHGNRLSAARAVEIARQNLECTIVDDIFNNTDEYVKSMDPLPCPITVAWGERDTLLPLKHYEAIVRETLPGATFTVLPDVAHVPMLDHPESVARTILAVTGAETT
ncbi:alpha/beta hydrolase [Mycobacterium sp. OTB74]|jgi:pimeloyl-ACP methyl ester carboxylesterase|uniref:alpha/beta fold hydrolase n=1 Tax=Mycobacterium sp. OTB74 TaxID=1853452 RepID=UPI00247372B7|nr:alpha/beta hydrolase [Mycobacterium sp. OTB74]MDH6247038.1 pimeloyl-ACP methyl ester carboxylesterase [Mycobacterium sp. OTB74]